MKKKTRVSVMRSDLADPQVFDELLKLRAVENPQYGVWGVRFESDDPILKQVLDTLHARGMVPWLDHSRLPLPNEYKINVSVTFESSDLKKAPLLSPTPWHHLTNAYTRNELGEVIIDTEKLYEVEPSAKSNFFAGTLPLAVAGPVIIVADSFRHMMEGEHIIGVKFEDKLRIIGPNANKVPEKYWVLTSDLVLPPLSKSIKKVDKQGRPVQSDDFINCSMAPGEIYKYDASALAPLGEFDYAIMWESRDQEERFPVVSNRFYKLCRKAKAKLQWEPIEIIATT